jgi:hypothetical protein
MKSEPRDPTIGAKRPVLESIEAQYRFFCSTVSKFYMDRNLSGVYSAIMDFSKYHFLDMILPFLTDLAKKDGDIAAFNLLHKVESI